MVSSANNCVASTLKLLFVTSFTVVCIAVSNAWEVSLILSIAALLGVAKTVWDLLPPTFLMIWTLHLENFLLLPLKQWVQTEWLLLQSNNVCPLNASSLCLSCYLFLDPFLLTLPRLLATFSLCHIQDCTWSGVSHRPTLQVLVCCLLLPFPLWHYSCYVLLFATDSTLAALTLLLQDVHLKRAVWQFVLLCMLLLLELHGWWLLV